MAWNDFWTKRAKPKKGGSITFANRFNSLFLQRVGIVNSYDDDVRTYIEKGYQNNNIVYAIVNNIAHSGSMAKWCIKDKNGNDVSVPLLEELMRQPNPLQSWKDLMQDMLTHKILEGNSFLTGEYGSGINAGKMHQLYVLPSEDIQIIASNDFRSIQGYKVDFAWSNDTTIPATEVLHLKNPNPDFDETDNWLFGQSCFRAVSSSIQTYNESVEAGLWFLQNKGSQKLLYTNSEDAGEMSPEDRDAFNKSVRQMNQGVSNNAQINLVDQKIGVLDISANAAEALVIEQRHQAALEIANAARFPHSLLGLKDNTYENAKEAKKGLWENCIIPELEEIKDGLNRWLAPQFGDIYLDYNLDHIDALQEDRLMRGKAIKEFAGMITVNEARQMAGLKPLDKLGEVSGDDLYVGFTQAVVNDQKELSNVNNDKGKEE